MFCVDTCSVSPEIPRQFTWLYEKNKSLNYANNMSKPTDTELKHALQTAIDMKERGIDADFMAKALLNHNYRLKYLTEVLKIADRYLNHGMADHERTLLLSAINKANTAEARTSGYEREDFGLE